VKNAYALWFQFSQTPLLQEKEKETLSKNKQTEEIEPYFSSFECNKEIYFDPFIVKT